MLTKAGRTSWQGAQAWRERPTKETGAGGKQDDGGVIVPKDLSVDYSAARDLFRDEGSFRLVGRPLCHLWSS